MINDSLTLKSTKNLLFVFSMCAFSNSKSVNLCTLSPVVLQV